MRQKQCEVKENCKNYLMGRGNCWYCTDYSQYSPEDRRILCKRQKRRRTERKMEKRNNQYSQASKRGKRSKKKGYGGEREVVNLLQKYGIKAERVPLSGALKTKELSCDVALDNGKRIEVKRRKSGMKTIQKWLSEDKYSNYVFFREDGDTDGWIVIMPYLEFIELLKGVS
jgi:hypothetical protein